MKKIFCKIQFEIDEDTSILNKLVSDGWKIQERAYYDAEFGLKGTKLKVAYLEYFYTPEKKEETK